MTFRLTKGMESDDRGREERKEGRKEGRKKQTNKQTNKNVLQWVVNSDVFRKILFAKLSDLKIYELEIFRTDNTYFCCNIRICVVQPISFTNLLLPTRTDHISLHPFWNTTKRYGRNVAIPKRGLRLLEFFSLHSAIVPHIEIVLFFSRRIYFDKSWRFLGCDIV